VHLIKQLSLHQLEYIAMVFTSGDNVAAHQTLPNTKSKQQLPAVPAKSPCTAGIMHPHSTMGVDLSKPSSRSNSGTGLPSATKTHRGRLFF
jgi:hypothetical protein